ncbi:hypothetical protein BBJ28_00025443 [Nothophytophthora sp. Chile5]|nr:hypothetical protein BBJ28_00025443 [Nothophytophthora sp. Chile5]
MENDKEVQTLIKAARSGSVQSVKQALKFGIDVDAHSSDNWTALIAASQKGHTDVVELLLANKASVNTQLPDGTTALCIACQYGRVGAVRVLLASGAAIELADDLGFTALMVASQYGHTDVVELLLANKASVQTQCLNGATALYIACQYGRVGAVRVLLASGAAIELADDLGFTALMVASQYGHTDVVELLLANKASKLKEASKMAGNHTAITGCWRGVKEQLLVYEGESRLLIKLADIARVAGFLKRATNTALGILNLLGSSDGISWHQVLDREREDRIVFFETLLADDERMAREMGDEQQQLEVLTRLKHGLERFGDVLNPRELDVMSAVFDAVVRYAEVVAAAVPQWFAISETE